jgi:collagenase-like PrtC family protease
VFPLTDEAQRSAAETWKAAGVKRILAHGIGAAELTGDFAADLSFRGNVTNAAAARVYRDAGFSRIGRPSNNKTPVE